ncbi:MAG: DUF2341 domain-containing protein [Candidatus Thorarchaeota archaeon]
MKNTLRGISIDFMLFLIILNALTFITPLSQEGFSNLAGFSSEHLRGLGMDEGGKTNVKRVPVLRNIESQTDSHDLFSTPGIRSSVQSQYSVPGWVDTRWNYRKNITIGTATADIINFPLYIELLDSDLRDHAQVSGGDIFFTDASGNKLDHEMEIYDRQYTNQQARLVTWVNLNLSSSQSTLISMYYGNPSAPNQQNRAGVWNTDYKFVLHMDQDPSLSNIRDSTLNQMDFNVEPTGGMSTADLVGGKTGFGIAFDGTDDYIYIPLSRGFSGPTDKFTFEFWIMFPNGGPSTTTYLAAPGTTSYDPRLSFTNNFNFEVETTPSSHNEIASTQSSFTAGNWYYIAALWDGGTGIQQIYIDGILDASGNKLGTHVNWNTLAIGAQDDATNGVGGTNPHKEINAVISEFRLSDTIKSPEWIQTTFSNQYNPNVFYSVGSEELITSITQSLDADWVFPSLRFRKNLTINASEVSSSNYLHNFPVLVDILDSDLMDTSKVQSDGDDIRFASDLGWVWSSELLVNGDFESGSTIPWIISGSWGTGTDPPMGGAGTHSGNYSAFISGSGSVTDQIYQDVSIGGFSSYIDSGKAVANVSGWMVSAETSFDSVQMKIQYLDNAKTVLSTPLDTGFRQPATWTKYSIGFNAIPINTRYIRVWATCFEDSWDAGSIDTFSVKVGTLEFKASGYGLDHEIEAFDQTTGHLTAWVRIPGLSNLSNTTLTMYYGNNVIPKNRNCQSVWESYEGVWHLNEQIGSGNYILDSTKNNHDGTPYSTIFMSNGITGGARNFTGSGSSRIEMSTYGNILSGNEKFTFSFWIYPDYISDAEWESRQDLVFFKEGVMDLTRMWRNPVWPAGIGRFQPDIKWDDGSTSYANVIIYRQKWNLIHYTYNGTHLSIYRNGTLISSSPKSGVKLVTNSGRFNLGSDGNYPSLIGSLDEFRISNDAKSASWIATEMNNLVQGSEFFIKGAEEEYVHWWADASYTYRKDILIDSAKVSGDLVGFPLLMDFTSTDLRIGNVKPDASDVLFTASNGNIMYHELESFVQGVSQGTLKAWVRIPSLSADNDTLISVYYGNNEISSQEEPSKVWDSYYAGVWHLSEDPTGGGPSIIDSTGNVNGSSIGSMTSNDLVAGQIENALNFDGTDDYVRMTGLGTNGLSSVTISIWINPDVIKRSQLLARATQGINHGLIINPGWNGMFFRLYTDVQNHLGTVYPTTGVWTHVTGTYDGSTMKLFVNGALVNSMNASGAIQIEDWTISGADVFDGLLDEGRVSTIARSSDWITTRYNNEIDPLNFISVGDVAVYDQTPPKVNNFGIDDLGNGIGRFWAEVSDVVSSVSGVTLEVNTSEYSMANNGTYWISQLPVSWNGYYEYRIKNASDLFNNFMLSPTSIKNHTFSKDITPPSVDNWDYDPNTGEYGTFLANVSDSWGAIDTVRVNVTYMGGTAQNNLLATMKLTPSGYLNDTIVMNSGTIKYVVIVNDTSGNSITSSEHQGYVPIANHAPTASNIVLNRISTQTNYSTIIYSNSTLYLNYTFSDIDGDSQGGTIIRWYRNGLLVSAYNNLKQVPSSELLKNHFWNVTVTPKDGQDFGLQYNSSLIQIQNSAPQAINVYISPENITTEDNLTANYNWVDSDLTDSETNTEIRWYRDNGTGFVLQGLYNDILIIPEAETRKGDTWRFSVTPGDGEDLGSTIYSPNITILNSPPRFPIVFINNNNVTSTENNDTDLVVDYAYLDPDNQENSSIDNPVNATREIRWYQRDILRTDLNNTLVVSFTETKVGDWWYYKIRISDGTDYSTWHWSSSIWIEATPNFPPLVENVTLNSSLAISGGWLFVAYDYYDPNIPPDPEVGTLIRWYRNSQYQSQYDNKKNLTNAQLVKGDTWYAEVRPRDGLDYGNWTQSTIIVIKNTAPVVNLAEIFPTSDVYTSNTLVATPSYSDIDGDPIIDTIIIWKNGSTEVPQLENSTIVPSNYTKRGEWWYYQIQVFDGTNWSQIIESPWTNIKNSKPTIDNLFLSGGMNTTDGIILYYDFNDSDGDIEALAQTQIQWFIIRQSGSPPPVIGGKTFSSTNFVAGDFIFCSVIPHDGTDTGDAVVSTYYALGYLIVGDSVPIVNGIPNLIGSNGTLTVSSTTTLYINYSVTDLDSGESDQIFDVEYDANNYIIGSRYRWYRYNNISSEWELQIGLTSYSIDPFYLNRGDRWKGSIRPRDKYGSYGNWANSTDIVIGNSYPVVNGFNWMINKPTTINNLDFTFTYFDWDNDLIVESRTLILWFKNGQLIPGTENQTVLSSYHFVKNDNISVIIRPFDGTNWASNEFSSPIITISNSLPQASNLTLAPKRILNLNMLYLNWSFSDKDNDSENQAWIIKWYKNGVFQPIWNNWRYVPNENISNDELWKAELFVYDGFNYSTKYSRQIYAKKLTILFEYNELESQIQPDIRKTEKSDFFVTDEDITIAYMFSIPKDANESLIKWFKSINGSFVEMSMFENQNSIPASFTSVNEQWFASILPYDGIHYWAEVNSTIITIESRPVILTPSEEIVLVMNDMEGHYVFNVSTYDESNPITKVEFTLTNLDNDLSIIRLAEYVGDGNWTLEFQIPSDEILNYLNQTIHVKITIFNTVYYSSQKYEIFSSIDCDFTIRDKAAPRVLDAWFVVDDKFNPTNVTFYAEIQDFGSEIDKIVLFYLFELVNASGGTGSSVFQNELQTEMIMLNQTDESLFLYHVTVPIDNQQVSWKVIYHIRTSDTSGNINENAFNILLHDPESIDQNLVSYSPPGVDPTIVLLIVGITLFLAISGSVVYVKFIRKPELIGLDEELVLNTISEISESEVLENISNHTLGIVVSFFDQRFGPIPIIINPEMLKDNYSALVNLSDRSFSGTGFVDDFESIIPSSYDFVLSQGLRTSVISFGFALDRPQARGKTENITLNILLRKDLFKLVNKFIDYIQERVHHIHQLMNTNPSAKEEISSSVNSIREFVSYIILSYERLYGTTELIEEGE